MSLHGGLVGVLLAIFYLTRKNGLSYLRICDYVAVVTMLGLFLVRLANFVNGELWGRPTTVPWGMIFPTGGEVAGGVPLGGPGDARDGADAQGGVSEAWVVRVGAVGVRADAGPV